MKTWTFKRIDSGTRTYRPAQTWPTSTQAMQAAREDWCGYVSDDEAGDELRFRIEAHDGVKYTARIRDYEVRYSVFTTHAGGGK